MRIEAVPLSASDQSNPTTRGRFHVGVRDLAAGVILFLGVVAFFWAMIRPWGTRLYIAEGDFSRQFYPFRWFEGHEWWSRRIPLWNADIFAGHPFQADIQTAVFYPLALVNAILLGRHGLPYFALEGEVVVHTLLAGIFTYALARHLTGSRLGALVSGVAFAFGGFITSYPAEQLPVLETAVWLPLIVLFLEMSIEGQVASRPGPDGIDGAKAGAAGQIQGKHPDLPLSDGGTALHDAAPRVTTSWRWLVAASLILGVSILAGHPQTVLFIVYATEGYLLWRLWRGRVRWNRILSAIIVYPLLGLGVSAIQILPTLEFMGNSTRDQMGYVEASWGYLPSALWEVFVPLWHGEKALSIGVAGLALAVIGAWASRREPLAYWTAAGLIAVPLSIGGATPLFWILYHVAPGWNLFRDQERVIYVFSFAAALLAGRGVAELQRRDLKASTVARWSAGVAVGAATFGALYLVGSSLGAPVELRINLALDVGALAAVAICLAARARSARLRGWVGVGLIFIVAGELFAINSGNNLSPVSPNPASRFARTAAYARAFPEPFRVRGISEKVFPSNYGMVLGMPTIGGDTPFQIRRMRDMLVADADWRVWQILNVKFFISDGGPLAGLKPVFSDGGLNTYFMTDSLPRVWAVRAVEVARNPSEARQMILAPGYHPGNIAVLEQTPSIGPFTPGNRPDVRLVHLDPQRIAVDTEADGNAMLVLADQYYPDWLAYRDGQPIATFRANYLAMAFELPPGQHHFEIVYRPWTFYLGAAISILLAIPACLFVAWPWLRRRGRPL